MSCFLAGVGELLAESARLIKGDSRDPQQWDPLMGSFPYYSHTTPIRIPKDMGMVWEAYHKGGPIVGGPWKIPLFDLYLL